MNALLPALLILMSCVPAGAAPTGELEFFDFERASLEETLNLKTRVASRFDFSAREAPGIVTVITRAEILNSGARNLIDVLRLVPGLDFGVDVESALGLGVRGNWAHEGKILVLVDGQRYNESFMGTAQLERISPEQVERIEIIRGPGSAVYGGFAALGVIKITTRIPEGIDGTEATLAYGRMVKTYGGISGNLAYGKVFENSELSVQAYDASLNRSDRRYTDFNGGSYSMTDASEIDSKNLNIGLKSSLVDLKLIADLHRTMQQDGWKGPILARPMARNFDAYFFEAGREFSLGEKLTLTPSVNYSYQKPFNGFDFVEYPRDKSSRFSKATVIAAYSATERVRLSGGTEISQDRAMLADTTPANPYYYFKGGNRSILYRNTAVFFEGVAECPLGLFSAGARYDKHEEFHPAFSPRLAWTKVFDQLHLKAIYSKSFRAPGIDNLAMNPALQPEKATVIELEAGYKLREDIFVSANIYDIKIKDPIVFYIIDSSSQAYGNYGRTGTKGFELTARLKKDWGYADFTYSYYYAAENGVAFYDAGAGSGSLLAFAPHKFTLNTSVKISPRFSVNPSAIYYAGRRGYYATDQTKRFDDVLLANINFSLKDLLRGRLELGLGIYDLFNSNYSYLQPYDGGHAPLPGPSREVRGRVSYKF